MVGAVVKVWTADEKGYGSVAAGARVVAAWYAVHDEKRRGDGADRAAAAAEVSRWDAWRAV